MRSTNWVGKGAGKTAHITVIILGVFCLLPFLLVFLNIGSPFNYLQNHIPPGQGLYVASKLAGIYSVILIAIQCLFALFPSKKLIFPFHAYLGFLIIFSVLTHIGCFVAASSIRSGDLSLGVVIPDFSSGFYRTGMSYGAVAMWILLLVLFSGINNLKGKRFWNRCHWLAIVSLPLIYIHSTSIGSEAGLDIVKFIYYGVGMAVAILLLFRMALRNNKKK